VAQVFAGEIADDFNLVALSAWANRAYFGGLILLWLAAALTVATGVDYLVKAMPHLREDRHD